MRSVTISLSALSGLVLAYAAAAQAAPVFKLSSTEFQDGATVPLSVVYDKMGCKGKDQSPELSWSGAPPGTKSFAVTIYDPDANTGSGFWHWTMFDIPASVDHLAASPSGSHEPDQATMQAVQRAVLPPKPAELSGLDHFVFTLTFDLGRR